MQRRIVIFGAGGHGREVLQLVRDINRVKLEWLFEGFLVDPAYMNDTLLHNSPILGDINWLKNNPGVELIVAVGDPAARHRITNTIRQLYDNPFATLIHPRAWVGDHVSIGVGSVICAGCLITTDVLIGEHVHVNIGSTLSHDVVLGDYATLSPNVSLTGNTKIGAGAEIGTGSIVIPRLTVGEWSVIGAGSTVTKPVPANTTAVGSPAKVIKERQPGWHEG